MTVGVAMQLGTTTHLHHILPLMLMHRLHLSTSYSNTPSISHAASLRLQLAESFMADFNIFISLNTHLLKDLLLVLINVLTDVAPVKHAVLACQLDKSLQRLVELL